MKLKLGAVDFPVGVRERPLNGGERHVGPLAVAAQVEFERRT